MRFSPHNLGAGWWVTLAKSPAALVAAVLGAAGLLELGLYFFPESAGKWGFRLAGWNSALLLANLVVLWWYA